MVKRQRADVQHTTALKLLRDYDTISLEDVQVANIERNHRLANSLSDAGWAPFRSPRSPGSVCWASSRRRATCLHQPGL